MASFQISPESFADIALEVIRTMIRENRLLRAELNMFTDHNYEIPSDQRSVLSNIGIPPEMMNIHDLIKLMKEYRFHILMSGLDPDGRQAAEENDVEKVLPPASQNNLVKIPSICSPVLYSVEGNLTEVSSDKKKIPSIFSPILNSVEGNLTEVSSDQKKSSFIPTIEVPEIAIAQENPSMEIRVVPPSACSNNSLLSARQNDQMSIPSTLPSILHSVGEESTKLSSGRENNLSISPVEVPKISQENLSVEIILNAFARRPPLLSPILSPCKEPTMKKLLPSGPLIVQKFDQDTKRTENTKEKMMSQPRKVEQAPRNSMKDDKLEENQVPSMPIPSKGTSLEKSTPITSHTQSSPLQGTSQKRAGTFDSNPTPETPTAESSQLGDQKCANSSNPIRVNKNTRCLNCRCKGHTLDSCRLPIIQCTRCLRYRHLAKDCRSSLLSE